MPHGQHWRRSIVLAYAVETFEIVLGHRAGLGLPQPIKGGRFGGCHTQGTPFAQRISHITERCAHAEHKKADKTAQDGL
jgi:hypothetical protein